MIQTGTRWHRKRMMGHADTVIVVKVTVNQVHFRERDIGSGYSRLPLPMFLGTYVPEPTRCAKCNSSDVRPGYRHCAKCTSLICAVQAKRKKEKDMLTTTSSELVEQKVQDRRTDQATPVAAAARTVTQPRVVASGVQRWRITGRRVIVEEQVVVVEGASVIDALAAIESQAPGLDVTDVHLLD
jgi:hypothetical protein